MTTETVTAWDRAKAADPRLVGPYEHSDCRAACAPVIISYRDTHALTLDLDGSRRSITASYEPIRAFEPLLVFGTRRNRSDGSIVYRVGRPDDNGRASGWSTYELRWEYVIEIDRGCGPVTSISSLKAS